MKEVKKNNDKNKLILLQRDVEAVKHEVNYTLEVLQHFQKVLTPRLDLSVTTLKGVRDNVKLSEPLDEESLSETDDDEDDSQD